MARLVVSGMTNREVSEELMLSTKTVEFHLSHVYAKLGVRIALRPSRPGARRRAHALRTHEELVRARADLGDPSAVLASELLHALRLAGVDAALRHRSPPGRTTVAVTFAGTSTESEKPSSVPCHALLIAPRTERNVAAHVSERAGRRGDHDVFVAGPLAVEPDAGHVLVEPLRDRAERVVVERVHHRGLEAVLLGPAVPALPDRGRAVADRVAPGRERLVEQEPVGDVGVARPRSARDTAGRRR